MVFHSLRSLISGTRIDPCRIGVNGPYTSGSSAGNCMSFGNSAIISAGNSGAGELRSETGGAAGGTVVSPREEEEPEGNEDKSAGGAEKKSASVVNDDRSVSKIDS